MNSKFSNKQKIAVVFFLSFWFWIINVFKTRLDLIAGLAWPCKSWKCQSRILLSPNTFGAPSKAPHTILWLTIKKIQQRNKTKKAKSTSHITSSIQDQPSRSYCVRPTRRLSRSIFRICSIAYSFQQEVDGKDSCGQHRTSHCWLIDRR